MMKTLSRFLNESVLLRFLLLPRRLLYRFLHRISPRLRRMADSSYFFFFIRHPANIRFKDYGLLLLAFELSFGLGRFMMNTLTPMRRNACLLLGLFALLAIGPLDRVQTRRGGKVFSLKAPFGFIIAALAFGFVGSFVSPPLFRSLISFLAILCICLHSPLGGLGAVLALFPLLPQWSTVTLILAANLIRMIQKSADQKREAPLSGRAFFFLLWIFFVVFYVLFLPDPLSSLVWLLLLFAYPLATDATTRARRISLFCCGAASAALWFAFPFSRTLYAFFIVTVVLGAIPSFRRHESFGKDPHS